MFILGVPVSKTGKKRKPQSYAEFDAEVRRERFFVVLCVTLRLTLRNSAVKSLHLTPLIPAQKMPDPDASESGIKQPKIN